MTREEAINTVRNIYQTDAEKEALATLIPELAESEDERIRKWLITQLQNNYKGNYWATQAITYLEKQKEEEDGEEFESCPITTKLNPQTDYMMNEKVIIRAGRAGVFYGTLVRKDGNEVELKDCRRIWYWDGACSISELAVSGTKKPGECKFSVTVPSIVILEVIEIIPCTEDAIQSIEAVKVWKA